MNLFADTSAWYAVYDQLDSNHLTAQALLQAQVQRRVQFCMTDYIWDETLTLIRTRLGYRPAVACGEWLLSSPVIRLIRIEPDLWNDAWALFRRYDDKEFSFTDCTSFVVMQRYHLVDAFAFDHHFEQMGFRLWPR
jgi:predicted nucleic acid-binding protein